MCNSTRMEEDPSLAALRRGLLEVLALAAVENSPRYAAEIVAVLRRTGFPAQEGTVYPLLNKLRRAGYVSHEWQESTSGPPRKYLQLTDKGTKRLDEFRTYWKELTTMIEQVGH